MNKTVTKAAAVIMTLFIMIFTMTGCGSSSSSSTTTTTAASKTSSSSSTDTSDRYSDRDCDATYDESTATKITLSKTKATVSGDGAKYSDGVLTISDEGTYIISGLNEAIFVNVALKSVSFCKYASVSMISPPFLVKLSSKKCANPFE